MIEVLRRLPLQAARLARVLLASEPRTEGDERAKETRVVGWCWDGVGLFL